MEQAGREDWETVQEAGSCIEARRAVQCWHIGSGTPAVLDSTKAVLGQAGAGTGAVAAATPRMLSNLAARPPVLSPRTQLPG